MDHRDYQSYTLPQLYEALDTVDDVESPGLRAAIEAHPDLEQNTKKELKELVDSWCLSRSAS